MAVLSGVLRPVRLENPFGAIWERHRRRSAERAAVRQLSHLDPRLLADMGLAPEAYSRRDGWDDLMPNGYLVRRR
jgi:hypothetical protein